jgi:hypothetical protein
MDSVLIDGRKHRRIGSGVYADVFAVDAKAFKAFKSGPEIPPRQTKAGRRRVFECQCEAFQLASADPILRNHIAAFYGSCVIEDVLDVAGKSIISSYLPDCCYALELIGSDGVDSKVTAEWVVQQGDHLKAAIERFGLIGIDVHDSSVFDYADPDRFKFIDIEMRDCY